MSTVATPTKTQVKFTYQDYLIWDIGPDKRYELIEGEFSMVPVPNLGHQHVSGEIEFKIRKFLEKKELGMVFDASCDVVLSLSLIHI